MSYETIGSVEIVQLGGVNKTTGENNPLFVEGYLLRTETRPNRFNPAKPQNFYILQTQNGDKGVFGKGGLDKQMSSAVPGRMTKITDTETVQDVGKGNPMRVFLVQQDKTRNLDRDTVDAINTQALANEPAGEEPDYEAPEAYVATPAPTPRPTPKAIAPPRPASAPSNSAAKAKLDAMIAQRKTG